MKNKNVSKPKIFRIFELSKYYFLSYLKRNNLFSLSFKLFLPIIFVVLSFLFSVFLTLFCLTFLTNLTDQSQQSVFIKDAFSHITERNSQDLTNYFGTKDLCGIQHKIASLNGLDGKDLYWTIDALEKVINNPSARQILSGNVPSQPESLYPFFRGLLGRNPITQSKNFFEALCFYFYLFQRKTTCLDLLYLLNVVQKKRFSSFSLFKNNEQKLKELQSLIELTNFCVLSVFSQKIGVSLFDAFSIVFTPNTRNSLRLAERDVLDFLGAYSIMALVSESFVKTNKRDVNFFSIQRQVYLLEFVIARLFMLFCMPNSVGTRSFFVASPAMYALLNCSGFFFSLSNLLDLSVCFFGTLFFFFNVFLPFFDYFFRGKIREQEDAMIILSCPGVSRDEIVLAKLLTVVTFFSLFSLVGFVYVLGCCWFIFGAAASWWTFLLISSFMLFVAPILFTMIYGGIWWFKNLFFKVVFSFLVSVYYVITLPFVLVMLLLIKKISFVKIISDTILTLIYFFPLFFSSLFVLFVFFTFYNFKKRDLST